MCHAPWLDEGARPVAVAGSVAEQLRVAGEVAWAERLQRVVDDDVFVDRLRHRVTGGLRRQIRRACFESVSTNGLGVIGFRITRAFPFALRSRLLLAASRRAVSEKIDSDRLFTGRRSGPLGADSKGRLATAAPRGAKRLFEHIQQLADHH